MNKLIIREFLPTGNEQYSYKSTEGNIKTGMRIRKRWYATMECYECKNTFTVLEKSDNSHISTPCEKCKARISAYNSFLKKAIAKHKDKFDYSLVTKDNYVNLFMPVSIICKVHGIFTQKPKDHTSKVNGKLCCPTCIQEFNKLHNKRSIESWKEELLQKAPHITMVQHGNSDSNREPCTLECSYHGTFNVALAEIKKSKYICSTCAQEHNSWGGRFRRTDISGILYLIYIPAITMYKLGVTSQSVQERFGQFPYSFEVVWQQTFETLKDAYLTEMQLFRRYKEYRNKSLYKDISGYTELLTCEIPITALRSSNTTSKEI